MYAWKDIQRNVCRRDASCWKHSESNTQVTLVRIVLVTFLQTVLISNLTHSLGLDRETIKSYMRGNYQHSSNILIQNSPVKQISITTTILQKGD